MWLSWPRDRGVALLLSRTRARSTSELSPRIRWFRERPLPVRDGAGVEDTLGFGNGRLEGTTASPKSRTVGALLEGVAVVVLLPDELDREGVDHPVTGDPIGWELLVRVGAGCVGAGRDGVGLDGAGRPLIRVPEVEEREGLTVERVGVTVRPGLDVLGRLVERVGEEMLLVDVERVRVGADGRVTVRLDELDRRALEDRCVEDRCAEDL